jgi:tyrosinase
MSDSIVLRTSVEYCDIAALRDAYGKMQALSATDNRSWIYWAAIHGFPDYDCWHHAIEGPAQHRFPYDLFLPWHRAYLVYWQNVAMDQNVDAIPPWWDWTSALSHRIGVPEAYAQPTADGGPNPLYNGPTPNMPDDPARRTRRFPGPPDELPDPSVITTLLSLPDYKDFSAQVQDVHDQIHGWAGGINPDNPSQGGDMGNIPSAAFDPIFWAHHCMIDRIWYLWQVKYGVDNIPPSYLDLKLAPFGYDVKEVLDINSLGYEYVTSAVTAPGPATAPDPGPASGPAAAAAQAPGPAPAAATASGPAAPTEAAGPGPAPGTAAPPSPAAPAGSQP